MEIEKNGASKAESDSAQVEHYLAQIFQFETVNGNTCRFSCMLCNPIVTECTAYCQFLFVDYIKCGIFLERKSMCVCIDFISIFLNLIFVVKHFCFVDSFGRFVLFAFSN